MVNRRIAKGHRLARKKKLKITKKTSVDESAARAGAGKNAGKRKTAATRVRVVNGVTKKQQHRFGEIESLKKQKSKLLKQQAAERMVLKEHMRDLEARKNRIRRGETAKTERRELAKYIRQLKQEQQVKHASELTNVEMELKRLINERDKVRTARVADGMNEEDVDWEDIGDADDDDVNEDELQRMFAHLTM
ncbi:conserved hypothetical protein [Leishmania braziliensis MHOM/BR/75/M2904]|uniref:Uncharacterized protein n=1 Tax=Leishmania braziliensis TaxID=5660 RepID=A4H9K6_LEIBR|nr:conserved hypothetical protein [Leishmania braziliensis MHOM/BR/75/M2904]KAI5691015.1 hypothetical protein MNV84_02575 [Leishmania braziliensis]CAJ2470407.1 unnamed protein product [Leishmania braziliensis]CAM38078.1 conserved hypothetical protein [Leishmania braziliensis MHOM/BR/75/M2904]